MKITIKNGNIQGFVDEIKAINKKSIENKKIQRVSLIIPKNKILRFLWITIRRLNNKKLTEWTRKWKCKWLLIFNNEVIATFKDRENAIKYEKEYIANKNYNKVLKNNNYLINYKLLKY